MSDYPSDDLIAMWAGGSVSMSERNVARQAIDWHKARANPAPQEPPTPDDDYADLASELREAREELSELRSRLDDVDEGEPTEAPKPTSGGKPPTTMSKLWFRMNAHAKEEEPDPRNPSPTREPVREPDPWALPEPWMRWGHWTNLSPGAWCVHGSGDHPGTVWADEIGGVAARRWPCGLPAIVQAIVARRNREDPPK